MNGVTLLWLVTLAAVVLVVVPLTVYGLHRVLVAALSVRRYVDEMLAAGVAVAGNTATIGAIDETISVAGKIVDTAGAIRSGSAQLAAELAARAERPARAEPT